MLPREPLPVVLSHLDIRMGTTAARAATRYEGLRVGKCEADVTTCVAAHDAA